MVLKSSLITLLLIAITHCNNEIQLTMKNYDLVLSSKEGWVIEFYSKKCSTCKEFEPIWLKVTTQLTNLKIGRVNIDDKEGLALAENLKILDDGIPQVRFVYQKDKFVTIMTGMDDLFNVEQLRSAIDNNAKKYLTLNKETGMYIKNEL